MNVGLPRRKPGLRDCMQLKPAPHHDRRLGYYRMLALANGVNNFGHISYVDQFSPHCKQD